MELRVSTDSILRCLGPLCDWDMESVLTKEASSSSISPPSPSPPPSSSSELEPPSPERRDRRSPDCRFWRLSDGARPRLFQLDRRLVQPLPELHGAWGEELGALVCSRKMARKERDKGDRVTKKQNRERRITRGTACKSVDLVS